MVPDEDTPETAEEESARLRLAWEAGDQAALMAMIYLCLSRDQPVPEWARHGFVQLWTWLKSGGVWSWDEALGPPHPAGRHLNAIRADAAKWRVYARIMELHEAGAAIDNELLDRVGRELGIGGKTVTAELYAKVKRALRRLADQPREKK